MASINTLQVFQNNYRNVIIRATQVSDGTNGEKVTIYNATSGGAFGVCAPGGQLVYPGTYTKLVGLDYDVQDMKMSLQWEATTDTDILVMGSAPEDFNWTRFGGITVPAGLAGATGSIKVKSLSPVVGATYSIILYLRKGVPQS